ncbi:hypothetical protein [Streptomyces sp. NBC_01320]|uniref:hypothetical protein n=1 Tax=Streptomyces sp. NBC_01320 TaxID=2903824 RepID=UPI002E144F45|nr:hypothetical protein OG395_00235 [Streptomyces sp. NBC_01320]WSK01173.1 hypothetical protein OG395_55115 [Streptomyces sp. NBC_01320]
MRRTFATHENTQFNGYGWGFRHPHHVEHLPDGTEHRTGIWITNQKARRDRLDTGQLRALAELGIDWAR